MLLREQYLSRLQYALERRKGAAPDSMRVLRANSSFGFAVIIGLADFNHLDFKNKRERLSVIRKSVRSGDTVLLEGLERGQNFPQRTAEFFGLPPDIRIVGWDNMSAFQKIASIFEESVASKELLGNARRALERSDFQAADALLAEFRQKFASIEERLKIAEASRDDSLLIELDETRTRFPMGRVFIYAGAAHLLENPKLLKRLRQERFIILAPKDSRDIGTNPSEVEEAESYIARMNKK